MAASAAFSINGTSSGAVIVTPSTTVNLAVLSVTGVRSVEWRIVAGSDPTITAPVITPAGSPLGATATLAFTTESVAGLGLAWLIECKVNGGVEVGTGQVDEALTKTMIFGKANSNLILPLVYGEAFERHATLGVYPDVNKALKNVGGGAGSQNLASVLGFGASAGGITITSLGAPSAGGDAANKTYVDGRTLAVLLASSTSAGGAKITNLGTPTNTTDAATKAYVDGLLGGGGGESLAATLAIGNTAGGQNIVGVGSLRSNAELSVQQTTNDILTTVTGSTYLAATSGAVYFKKGANTIATLGDNGTLNILSGASNRSIFYITADPPAADHGRSVYIRGSDGVGTNKNGGIVSLQGGDPTGSGDAGSVIVRKTDDSELAKFADALITFNAPVTSAESGTFGYVLSLSAVQARTFLMIQGAGTGTPTGSTGDQRVRNGYSMVGRNQADSANLQLLALDTSNRTVLGNATGETHLDGSVVDAYSVLKVRGTGSATPVATTGHIRGPKEFSLAIRGFGGVDLPILVCSGVSGDGLVLGNSANVSTDIRSQTSTRLVVAGTAALTARAGDVVINRASLLMIAGGQVTAEAGVGDGTFIYYLGQGGNTGVNGLGGEPILAGGHPGGSAKKAGAKIALHTNLSAFETMVHATEVASGRRVISLFADVTTTEMPASTGDLVAFIKNAATAPTANPVGGGILYCEAGALKYRGTGGTITTLGAA